MRLRTNFGTPDSALAVFKSVRDSLPGSVATWAFSGCGYHVTQDHPVYIARAVQRLVRWMGAEHLIRRSRQLVQGRPSLVVCWTDIPHLSAPVGRCPAAWQQSAGLGPCRSPAALAARVVAVRIGPLWTPPHGVELQPETSAAPPLAHAGRWPLPLLSVVVHSQARPMIRRKTVGSAVTPTARPGGRCQNFTVRRAMP